MKTKLKQKFKTLQTWELTVEPLEGSVNFTLKMYDPGCHPPKMDTVANGNVKFDGCSNVMFEPQWLHFCNKEMREDLYAALEWAHSHIFTTYFPAENNT